MKKVKSKLPKSQRICRGLRAYLKDKIRLFNMGGVSKSDKAVLEVLEKGEYSVLNEKE